MIITRCNSPTGSRQSEELSQAVILPAIVSRGRGLQMKDDRGQSLSWRCSAQLLSWAIWNESHPAVPAPPL